VGKVLHATYLHIASAFRDGVGLFLLPVDTCFIIQLRFHLYKGHRDIITCLLCDTSRWVFSVHCSKQPMYMSPPSGMSAGVLSGFLQCQCGGVRAA